LTRPRDATPKRGEIWLANLDPTVGHEIRKTRPVVVISSDHMGALPVKLTSPATSTPLDEAPWRVRLSPTSLNGLDRPTTVDALQTRALSIRRFIHRIGRLTEEEMQEITTAVALVIEYV
jgi:mRNA interferase MazF